MPIRPDWEKFKAAVMLDALRLKFADPQLRQRLIDTGDRVIGEDSPKGFEWGVRDPGGGYAGQNLLGLALMRVRDEIRAELAHQTARISDGLDKLGVQTLFHITRASALPAIAADGELRSIYARVADGDSPQPQSGHGAAQGLTWGYVSLSFQPAWFLCKRYDEELVLLEVDARAALSRPGTLTSPINCASQHVDPGHLLDTTNLGTGGAPGLAACFDLIEDDLARSTAKKDAEVLVPDRLALTAVTGLVFCDPEARDHWWSQIQQHPSLAGATVRVSSEPGPGLPPGWAPAVRHRPRTP